jgi:Fe-S cluster biosynthesis and repair protein YggX
LLINERNFTQQQSGERKYFEKTFFSF